MIGFAAPHKPFFWPMAIQYHVGDSLPRERRAMTPSCPRTNGLANGEENCTTITSESRGLIVSIARVMHDPRASTGTMVAALTGGADLPRKNIASASPSI